jgi:hypothetical protein
MPPTWLVASAAACRVLSAALARLISMTRQKVLRQSGTGRTLIAKNYP